MSAPEPIAAMPDHTAPELGPVARLAAERVWLELLAQRESLREIVGRDHSGHLVVAGCRDAATTQPGTIRCSNVTLTPAGVTYRTIDVAGVQLELLEQQ